MVTLKGASREFYGTSQDDKPLDVEVNAIFHELDSKKDYYFTGEEWLEVGGTE